MTICYNPSVTTENKSPFISLFRGAAPYINAHRGKTFVISFSGNAIKDKLFRELIHDIALLNSLGVRLVLVHGARPQIEEKLASANIDSEIINELRITSEDAIQCVKEAIGGLRIKLEGEFSNSMPNSPMSGAKIRIASGNFVTARPLGVLDGIDYQHTGEVRRVDKPAIESLLDDGFIVLLSPIGTSPTGEIFNLSSEEVATTAATQIGADKMVLLLDAPGLLDGKRKLIRQLTPDEAETILSSRRKLPAQTKRGLLAAIKACREGLPRAHIISSKRDGSLLQELFTRDGIGTMITSERYESIRPATIDDIGGIIELITPLERDGILVPRSRELLEIDINHYTVMERDGTIIGVVALYPDQSYKIAEVASLAIHPEYQNEGRGEALLKYLDRQIGKGMANKIERLFVLSTHASHWFQEQGYSIAKLTDLPIKRRSLYNYKRNSKVFMRDLGDRG